VPTSQQFAIDIHKLGSMGSASANLLSGHNDDHHIYGELVYSPCTGKILRAVNDVEANENSTMDVSAAAGQGNFVDIDYQGRVVSLVHLQKGSITVAERDEIQVGQVIGKVGNSGFSQEPHLHFQIAAYSADSSLIGIPMSINERFLVRNDIVNSW
jgi:murein DD-endopeptidase MepM/ murein hydrolase activator NlpD